MAQALLPEDLWSLLAVQLPNHCRSAKGGRPRVDDPVALMGIVFVLRTGIPGCGPVFGSVFMTRSYADPRVRPDSWDRASIDAASVPAPFGGEHIG